MFEIKSEQKTNRLELTLKQLLAQKRKALAIFLMGGDPNLELSRDMCLAALSGGADILEIGVPFSDPLADGPVIQKAAGRALQNGTKAADILNMVAELRLKTVAPIVLLSYYNIIYRYGLESFFISAKKCGVDALVIPDLPHEEKEEGRKHAEKCNIILIEFLTPTTPSKRGRRLVKKARGFIYCVALTGVTGVRDSLSQQLRNLIARARQLTPLPLLAGFGISTPDQARKAAQYADGVIVGSALIAEIEKEVDHHYALPPIIQKKVEGFRDALFFRPGINKK